MERFLRLSGLEHIKVKEIQDHLTDLALQLKHPQQRGDDALFSYNVPELGEGGSCSLFGHVAKDPYDLSGVLGQPNPQNRALLAQLNAVVDYVIEHSTVDWYGIYQTLGSGDEQKLVKLAYHGAISRAEYPLTAAYAEISNNVSVGRSGQAKIINDVSAYINAGGAYYTCDPKVKAEVCLPIFSAAEPDRVIGIIDAEAFSENFFDPSECALLVASCLVISSLLE